MYTITASTVYVDVQQEDCIFILFSLGAMNRTLVLAADLEKSESVPGSCETPFIPWPSSEIASEMTFKRYWMNIVRKNYLNPAIV